MSTPIKDNEHIRDDAKSFMDAYRRARAKFGRIKGVVGVGYGLKEKTGNFTADVAILAYVLKKQPAEALSPEHFIPPTFEGYRTDVRVLLPETPTSLLCDDDAAYATITGGIQIEAAGPDAVPGRSGRGTLGCIVKKRGDSGDDNVYLLTCHHVLLNEIGNATYGDGVYHPYMPRKTPTGTIVTSGTLLGEIEEEYVRLGHVNANGRPVADEPSVDPAPEEPTIDRSFEGFYVDCGAVRINLGSFCCGSACTRNDIVYDTTIPFLNLLPGIPAGLTAGDLNRITDVRDLRTEPPTSVAGLRVVKLGRKTGRSVGIISAIKSAHSIVTYPPGSPGHVIGFRYNVIEIALAEPPPAVNSCAKDDDEPLHPGRNSFSWEGDSGALIVDEQNRAVGLLYGKSGDVADSRRFLTHACLIVPVLDTLGMCIPTTSGTSRGSSRATDGSGLVAYGGEMELPQDDGKVLFSAHGVPGAVAAKARPALVAPATEEQRARMLPLLDALCETERGRELHEAFSQLSREIAYLVRRSRPVKVAWHRHRGPAFLACVLNHLRGDAATIPHEIGGVSSTALLARMGKVLFEHGSNPLREAIERHREVLMLLANADTARECIEILRRAESIEVPA